LDVEQLGLDVRHRRADPHPGVVDEHVEAPVAVAMGIDDPLHHDF
jgi:hypothetical protein